MGKKQYIFNEPVEFGGVSIGEATCRLGIRINREHCNINMADDVFVGHRLTGKVVLGGSDESPGQGKFLDNEHCVEGSFDVKRVGVTPETITTGLTFSLKDIDIAELSKFSKGAGRLMVEGVGDIPEDAPDEHDEDKDQISLKFDGDDPRDCKLSRLFDGVILKGLLEGKLDTVGMLADYTSANKDLTDLPGIGPGKAEKITKTLIEFWKQNKA